MWVKLKKICIGTKMLSLKLQSEFRVLNSNYAKYRKRLNRSDGPLNTTHHVDDFYLRLVISHTVQDKIIRNLITF